MRGMGGQLPSRRADLAFAQQPPGGVSVNRFRFVPEVRAAPARTRGPGGPLETKWTRHKSEIKLVNPANKPTTTTDSSRPRREKPARWPRVQSVYAT